MKSAARVGKTKNPRWKETFVKIYSVTSRLAPQFGYDTELGTWKSPEARLMLAVIEQALIDYFNWNQVMHNRPTLEEKELIRGAGRYLAYDLRHAEMAGVDSDYVRRVMKEEGLKI